MLESCLNTPKLRNGGKVYIKDAHPKLKQSNVIVQQQQILQIGKKILPKPNQTVYSTTTGGNSSGTNTAPIIINQKSMKQSNDFIGSIMQAVGIQVR